MANAEHVALPKQGVDAWIAALPLHGLGRRPTPITDVARERLTSTRTSRAANEHSHRRLGDALATVTRRVANARPISTTGFPDLGS